MSWREPHPFDRPLGSAGREPAWPGTILTPPRARRLGNPGRSVIAGVPSGPGCASPGPLRMVCLNGRRHTQPCCSITSCTVRRRRQNSFPSGSAKTTQVTAEP